MSRIIKRAIGINIVVIFVTAITFFEDLQMNSPHQKEALLIIFLGELTYWLTIIVGLHIIKRKNKNTRT
ncbi:hypothetical protein [uncultured Anaerococcus sp.]|uniref:hypothetical protein n=1 Tax=uncultured Anaerococcus sp. TaxID=293428 RepID=UPI00288B50AC|nr:hypothetical protein [uncultured Anaerococcus sp.]